MAGFDIQNKNIGEGTRKPKEDLAKSLYEEMFENDTKIRQINEKILLSGENGVGKTSLALDLALHDIKDDEIVMYLEIDNSGAQIIRKNYLDYIKSGQLRIANVVKTHEVNGKSLVNEEKTVANAGSAAITAQMALDNGFKVKAVIVDGLSFILKYCEAVMRINKNKAADEGIPMGAWKIRNDEFMKFYSPFMILPTSVIFIAHEDFVREMQEEGRKFANVKQLFINECSMRIVCEKRSGDNPHVTDYYAMIKKHRANVLQENEEYNFFSKNNKTKKLQSNIEELYDVVFPKHEGETDDQ